MLKNAWILGLAVGLLTGGFAPATVLAQAPTVFSQKGGDQPGTRSAKSDCEGEARRRGYTVIDTGNFKQYADGWSIDMRVRDSRGRESTGSCYVETRTGNVSLYGFGWGNEGGDSSSFEFNCASVDTKYRECQLPVDGQARLVKRYSDARCDEGYSWGQRGDRVWVDHGCRARFVVERGGGGGSGGGRVDCRPKSTQYSECRIDRGYIGRLERDYSSGRCTQYNWGTSDGVVWVRNGCQARFTLERISAGGVSGSQSPGQQQRAETQCRNEARKRGMDVRSVAEPRWRGSYWDTTVEGYYRGGLTRATCRFYPDTNYTELSL